MKGKWRSVPEPEERINIGQSEEPQMPNTQYTQDGKILTSEWTLNLVKDGSVEKLKRIIADNSVYREYDEQQWNRFTIPQTYVKNKDQIPDAATLRKAIEDPNNYKDLERQLQGQTG